MGTPLQKLEGICAEIYSQWDKDQRSGKLLSALAGGIDRYRQDVTDVRNALTSVDKLYDCLGQALRQWKMYAELQENRNLDTEDSPEGVLYRELLTAKGA